VPAEPPPARAPAPLIPLEQFFDNPERAGGRLSPDGAWISYIAPVDGVLNVWVRPRDGDDRGRPVTRDRDRGVRAHVWTRDGRWILFMRDEGGNEDFHVFAVDPAGDGSRERDLTPFPGVKASILAVPRATPRHLLVSLNLRDRTVFDAYRLTIASGRLELVAENPGDIVSWIADREGRLRAARAQTPAGDYEIRVRDAEAGPMRVVARFDNEDGGHVHGFRADGGALYVGSARDSDLRRLVELDLADGSERVLDADDEADLGGPVISDRTGALLGAAYVRDRLVMRTFDDAFRRDWERLAQVHDGDPAILGSDADERAWIVGFGHDRDPGATYLVERDGGEARFLHRSRPWLDPAALAEMRPVRITARDGLTLRSYLTLPVGVEPRGLPTVLVVHGGPWSRDSWGYDPEAQFLANRGYAVLQVNYRGSTGFGKRFMHAAEHEFAGRMHDDLIDGVDWAVAEGIADPERVGIYGGSYGGYAALVGVTFTPDVFAAAVSYVGPSSLVTVLRSTPPYWRPLLAGTWHRYVGDPDDPEQRPDIEARSPLNFVDRIRTPLLVVQGANDPRVKKHESDQIVAALRERGVAVEYIVKDDEGHGFVKPENRIELYRAVEGFFAVHLGGRREDA
jgi:dipeptidyl aminopeptidase/acylaminoacyl peptidase